MAIFAKSKIFAEHFRLKAENLTNSTWQVEKFRQNFRFKVEMSKFSTWEVENFRRFCFSDLKSEISNFRLAKSEIFEISSRKFPT